MSKTERKFGTKKSERKYRLPMPDIPSKWWSRKHGTRHVVDQTLGGEVVYVRGRLPGWVQDYHHKTTTLEEWHEYQKTAKLMTN